MLRVFSSFGKHTVHKIFPILMGVLFTTLAWADPGDELFEVTPYGAYSFGGTFTDEAGAIEASLQDSSNTGLILNFRETSNTQWELIYSRQSTNAAMAGTPFANINLQYLQGGGTYEFEGNKARPFMAATIGGTHIDADEDGFGSDTFFSFSIGGGIQLAPTSRVGLRLETRAFGTVVRSDSEIFCVSVPASCAIHIKGDLLWQVQTMLGVVFRF